MKKVFQVLVLSVFVSPVFSQTVDVDKMRICIGKVTTILYESAQFEYNKPVNPKHVINYNSDDFKHLWKDLNKQTNNFQVIKIGKIYEIKGEGGENYGFDDPIEWRITFLNQNVIQFSEGQDMGTASGNSFKAKYNLDTNQYQTEYLKYGRGNPTYTVNIKNDIVINKHMDN